MCGGIRLRGAWGWIWSRPEDVQPPFSPLFSNVRGSEAAQIVADFGVREDTARTLLAAGCTHTGLCVPLDDWGHDRATAAELYEEGLASLRDVVQHSK